MRPKVRFTASEVTTHGGIGTGFVCYEKKYGHACIKASIAREREKIFLLTFCAIAGNRGGFTGVSPFRPGGGVWGGGSEIFWIFSHENATFWCRLFHTILRPKSIP